MSNKILVIGGSGGVGGSVVTQLIALSPCPPLRVSSRDPAKLSLPPHVEVVKGDLSDPSSFPSLFAGIEKVFLYVQGTNSTLPDLLGAAKSAGVKKIVFLSSYTVAYRPDSFLGKMHGRVENAIKDAGFIYTFLRPSSFATQTINFWSKEIKSTNKVSIPVPDSYTLPIADEDTAAVAVVALTTSSLDGAAPILNGPKSVSQRQQVEIISKVRMEKQGKGVELVQITGEKWRELATEAKVLPAELIAVAVDMWKATENKPQEPNNEVLRISGKATDYEAWVRLHANELF